MKFTEEQIKAILECIENTNIEFFRSEWEEIEESLRRGTKMECPYCNGKCGTHAQCVKCGKEK